MEQVASCQMVERMVENFGIYGSHGRSVNNIYTNGILHEFAFHQKSGITVKSFP